MRFALTTFDNPYDPFEQFTQWFMFDEEKGYHTTAYLGRIARTSDQLSDEENNKEVERAIDEIIRYDFQNIYRKRSTNKEHRNCQCLTSNSINSISNFRHSIQQISIYDHRQYKVENKPGNTNLLSLTLKNE